MLENPSSPLGPDPWAETAGPQSQYIRPKALLLRKKPLAFRGAFPSLAAACVLAGFAAFLPRSAEAGFFAVIAKFLGAQAAEVEETLSAFPPVRATEASALEAGNRPPAAEEPIIPIGMLSDHALVAPLNPLGTLSAAAPASAGQIFVYTVRPGDTLAGIARSFDVSVNTILWANDIRDARGLKPGDSLLILPVSGVRHEVRRGDTLSGIARRYRASIDEILQFNGLAPDDELVPGVTLIIPNGEFPSALPLGTQPRAFTSLPAYEGYYLRPVVGGRRSRGLHGYNGVDLANSCSLPVLAAAEGTVLIARGSGWNGGYGRYAVIAHPNGTQTLYAHLREILVAAGQMVNQGVPLGAIGSSGNSTGCHVHFEIRGAKNPF